MLDSQSRSAAALRALRPPRRTRTSQHEPLHARRPAPGSARTLAVAALAAALAVVAVVAAGLGLVAAEVSAVAVFAAAVAAFRTRPDLGFISWLVAAPYLQTLARSSEAAAPLAVKLGLYLAPPVAFAAWGAVAALRGPRPQLATIDRVPAAFLVLASASILLGAAPYGDYDPIDLIQQLYASVAIGVVCFYVAAFAPLGRAPQRRVVGALLVTTVVVAAMALVEKATGWNLWGYREWQEKAFPRVSGPLFNPAALGALLGGILVVALAILLSRSPRVLRRLALVTLVLGIPALVFTYQRAAYLGFAVPALALVAIRPRARLVAAAAVVAALAAVALLWEPITSSRVYTERIANTSTPKIRERLTIASVELAAERPLLGWGYGAFDAAQTASRLGLPLAANPTAVFVTPRGISIGDGRADSGDITVPSTLLSPARGWVATRVRIDWRAPSRRRRDPIFFAWVDDRQSRIFVGYDVRHDRFAAARQDGASIGYAMSPTQSFAAGSLHTLVARWTPTRIGISVDGSRFRNAAATAVPALEAAVFHVGQYAPGVHAADARFLWLATGRGRLGDREAAAMARWPAIPAGGAPPLTYGFSNPAAFTSHNTFLTVLVELGFVGLALLLLPWLVIAYRGAVRAARGDGCRWFLPGCVGLVAAFIINASFVDMRFFSFVPALPWLALGLIRRELARDERAGADGTRGEVDSAR